LYAHHAERLVNPKDLAQKNRLLILDPPVHVDSEKLNRQIDLSIFSKRDLIHSMWLKLAKIGKN
jgi:hypothetical protein